MYNTWEELKSACENCHRCELCETRTNVVVGVGNENAEVMFIGEGPGENEDLQGDIRNVFVCRLLHVTHAKK